MTQDILTAISQTVAQSFDTDQLDDLGARLNTIIPASLSPDERAKALDQAIVYTLYAEQPGYPKDGRPGYLAASVNLKAAVLNEINAMIRADFDQREHNPDWKALVASLEAAPESDFSDGVEVNCPDDYLLVLAKLTCGDLLRKANILPAWA